MTTASGSPRGSGSLDPDRVFLFARGRRNSARRSVHRNSRPPVLLERMHARCVCPGYQSRWTDTGSGARGGCRAEFPSRVRFRAAPSRKTKSLWAAAGITRPWPLDQLTEKPLEPELIEHHNFKTLKRQAQKRTACEHR